MYFNIAVDNNSEDQWHTTWRLIYSFEQEFQIMGSRTQIVLKKSYCIE